MKKPGKKSLVERSWHKHPLGKRVKITQPLRLGYFDTDGSFVFLDTYGSNVQDQRVRAADGTKPEQSRD